MPRLTDATWQARRQTYLEAAWRCFAREGVERTTMATIAREAGLSAGSSYVHFRSKDELVRAAITTSMDAVEELVHASVTDGSATGPVPYLTALLRSIEQFATRMPGVDLLPLAVEGWAHAQHDPETARLVAASYTRIRGAWTDLARRWAVPGGPAAGLDPAAVAQSLGLAVLGHVAQRVLVPGTDLDAEVGGLAAWAAPHGRLTPRA